MGVVFGVVIIVLLLLVYMGYLDATSAGTSFFGSFMTMLAAKAETIKTKMEEAPIVTRRAMHPRFFTRNKDKDIANRLPVTAEPFTISKICLQSGKEVAG